MKKFFVTFLVIASLATNAQVGIGVAATDVEASAQLEVKSTTKGLLSPRMTEAQKNAISTPATGLLIYQTDGTSGFYYYDGSIWKQGLGPQGVAGAAGASGQTNTSLLYSSIATYADGAAPTDAPSSVTSNGNFGWYFKNTNSGSSRKINWYIAPKSTTMTVSDLKGLYLEFFNVAMTNASDMPFIAVYTKPTGVNDAASWYKSRRFYTFSGSPTANTRYLGFANLGAASPNTYNTSLLNMGVGTTTGTFASTEEIIFISIVSNSASLAGACEFVANKFGIVTGTSTQEFLFMPPSSIANLSGFVDLTTSQTIAGSKTFNSDVTVNGIKVGKGNSSESTNTILGYNVLNSITSGGSNVAIGYQSLYSNTVGNNNTSVGVNSMNQNISGGGNVAFGQTSLYNNTTGSENAAFGAYALVGNTTGGKNIGVGQSALGTNETGSNNTAIGYSADVTTGGLTNATAIGYDAKVDANNKIQLGNSSVTSVNTSATITGAGFKTPSGTSSQYLMADGSVSSGSSSPTYAVGDSYGGGIVFYVTPDGKHGLISETQLISPNSNSSQNEDIYNFSQAQNMISNPNNHSTNGKLFTDWRLPTSYEFSVLYANKSYFSSNYQGRLNYYNWTSTPAASPNETSKMVYYYNGVAGEAGFNGGPCGVIAVRSF
jgi:hypothetical protein